MIEMPAVKRFLLGLSAVVILEVLAAPPVSAAEPVRQKLDIPPTGTFSGLCAFDVDYAIVVNTEYTITWFDSAGNPLRGITEGRLVVGFSNASNPAHHMTLNISGPGKTTFNADGSQTIVFLGNSLVFLADDMVLSSGRLVVVAPDPLSPGVVVSASGNQRSLCDLLG